MTTFKEQMAEDLVSVFYNTDEFAYPAVYTPVAGDTVSCNILVDHDVLIQADGYDISTATLGTAVTAQVVDVGTVSRGDTFTITAWRVVGKVQNRHDNQYKPNLDNRQNTGSGQDWQQSQPESCPHQTGSHGKKGQLFRYIRISASARFQKEPDRLGSVWRKTDVEGCDGEDLQRQKQVFDPSCLHIITWGKRSRFLANKPDAG